MQIIFLLLIISRFPTSSWAQSDMNFRDQYIMTDEQKLQIVVHIWGEVNTPGQYIVPDGTNMLELISLAGGPNEYSNLGSVILTRHTIPLQTKSGYDKKLNHPRKSIYKVNLNKYLGDEKYIPVHTLQPGDIVKVNRNNWHRFQTFIRVLYQVAIIAQGLYWYTQIFE